MLPVATVLDFKFQDFLISGSPKRHRTRFSWPKALFAFRLPFWSLLSKLHFPSSLSDFTFELHSPTSPVSLSDLLSSGWYPLELNDWAYRNVGELSKCIRFRPGYPKTVSKWNLLGKTQRPLNNLKARESVALVRAYSGIQPIRRF